MMRVQVSGFRVQVSGCESSEVRYRDQGVGPGAIGGVRRLACQPALYGAARLQRRVQQAAGGGQQLRAGRDRNRLQGLQTAQPLAVAAQCVCVAHVRACVL
jgi:hypothetical protein